MRWHHTTYRLTVQEQWGGMLLCDRSSGASPAVLTPAHVTPDAMTTPDDTLIAERPEPMERTSHTHGARSSFPKVSPRRRDRSTR